MVVRPLKRPAGAQLGEIPRPGRAALPYALLALAAGAGALLAPHWWVPALGVAGLFVLLAAVRAAGEFRSLRRVRVALDGMLVRRAPSPDLPLLERRRGELTKAKQRERVAHDLRRILNAADAHSLPGASPLNRVDVRREREALEALAGRLEDLERPVEARGVLLARALLTDPESPLFAPNRGQRLGRAADDARLALEP